eukprot:NODE_3077_length_833_cov_389.394602.p1 GENE.NODE_3077_length_833_cov_389.394602~~NODE_3077_length_833_cov_389.394602.p1  ORF type:complete len:189 (+),score=67.02 NODE_3077_length_833_cov_389.394602:104-670(+)
MVHAKYSREPKGEASKACKARIVDVRVHFKNTYEAAMAVRGMNLQKAVRYMQDVCEKRRCVPYRKFLGCVSRTPQCKEWKVSQGRWPIKSCKIVIGLLRNAESNAEFRGLDSDNLIITHVQVNRAKKGHRRTYRAHGRMGAYMNSPSHIEMICEEQPEDVDKPPSTKKAKKFTKSQLGKSKLRVGGGV